MQGEITALLKRIQHDGDPAAQQELFERVYGELLNNAQRLMNREVNGHTLEPTDLLHEAVRKLLHGELINQVNNRKHLFGLAVLAMKRILIDHARKRIRRGASVNNGLDGLLDQLVDNLESRGEVDLVELHEALDKLEELKPRQRKVVEYRFFGGLTIEQTAELLDISPTTVQSDLRLAKATLFAELNHE